MIPGLAKQIGGHDFEISLTLDCRSAPLTERDGTNLQQFGVLLKFEHGTFLGSGANIFFGFSCGPTTGNRPFCYMTPESYYLDDFDATGTDETITLRRVGDTLSIADATNGSAFRFVAGQLVDGQIHANINHNFQFLAGRTLTGITLCTQSPADIPFPDGAGRFGSLRVESTGLSRDINRSRSAMHPSTGLVQGQVNAGGRSLARASVSAVRSDTATTHYTDQNGQFRHRLAPGQHTLRTSAAGARTIEKEITVVAGTTTQMTFELERLPVELYVDANAEKVGDGSSARPFNTIQHALELCGAGSVVHIAAGTYPDHIELIPDVTLSGAGDDRTFVTGNGYWGLALRPFIRQQYISWQDTLIKAVVPNVHMSGFTLDPAGIDERDYPTWTADEITPLLQAVMAIDQEDADTLSTLLDSHPGLANRSFHAPDAWPPGASLLVRAAFTARGYDSSDDGVRVAELLCQHGADLSAVGGQYHSVGHTALAAAAWFNNKTFAQALLDAGADPNEGGVHDVTPLRRALGEGHRDMAEFLLERGADPTPDVLIALNRLDDLARLIQQDPALIHDTDQWGADLLHMAVSKRSASATSLALAAGADPTVRDVYGAQPLDRALRARDRECIQAIIAGGVEPDLLTAVVLDDLALAQRIAADDPGAAKQSYADGWTPLDAASAYGRSDIEAWLRSVGCQPRRLYGQVKAELAADHTVQRLLARTLKPHRIGYARIDYQPVFNTGNAITVMLWVYPLDAQQEGCLMARNAQWPAPGCFVMRSMSNAFELQFTDRSSAFLGDYAAPFFEWSHLCGT